MQEKTLGVQEAIDWAARRYDSLADDFNTLYRAIPGWGGPLDWDIQTFMHGVAQWVLGNLLWSYEGGRYFGHHGLETRATRTLSLRPRTVEPLRENIRPVAGGVAVLPSRRDSGKELDLSVNGGEEKTS